MTANKGTNQTTKASGSENLYKFRFAGFHFSIGNGYIEFTYISDSAYRYMYPAQSLHKAGAVIAGGSDWPVSSPNPFNAIAQAENPQRFHWAYSMPSKALDRESMFYAYTLNAAKAPRLDPQIGSPGARQTGRPDRARP